ncbi:radical SAM protein [Azospirillum sp. TSH100]|uniref:radical SAM protein n=1 Tax=Azospirillum sp. TSH100 TaxID=652764 RepID=UPI000D642779|nr:radical SAM protein [Azospirillum sp. TSH100]QCG92161.1 radical SAM protein [Azospirillum sp. TSH100]
MIKADSGTLLKLNALIRSNRLKFAGVLAADLLGIRYTIVRLDPVVACNLRCAMCYFSDPGWYAGNAGPRFTPEQVERIAGDFFPEALQLFIGCGSEPTMWKGYPGIVGLAKRHGVPFVSLVTNAQLLTRPAVDEMLAHGLDEIVVSVHGTRAETYETLMKGARWQRLHDNLAMLVEAKRAAGLERPMLRLNYTVNNDNLAQMTALLSVFGCYGPSTIQIRPMADLGDTAYTDKDLRRSLDAYNAGIARLRRDCETAGVRLLANTQDPLYRSENQRAVVYEHAVLRYIGPQRVWREGFDPMTESYGMLKRRTGFRRSLLRWAALGSSDLERASTLSTSDVF